MLPMLGNIGIEQLKIMTLVGVYPEERLNPRELILDIKLELDLAKCIRTDELSDTLDYDAIVATCEKLASESSFLLIEAFANVLIEKIMHDFPITQIWLKVSKPGSIRGAKSSFVEFQKGRGS